MNAIEKRLNLNYRDIKNNLLETNDTNKFIDDVYNVNYINEKIELEKLRKNNGRRNYITD